MAARLLPPFYQVVDANGRPQSGARLYTYDAGTSTPRATWRDAGLTIANTNPVLANAAGMFPDIFVDDQDGYHVVLRDRHDATIEDADPVLPTRSGGSELVTFEDYGAIGDNIADDTAAVAAALVDADGRTINGHGRTYRLTSTVQTQAQNFTLVDARFDLSALTGLGTRGIEFAAPPDTQLVLHAAPNAGDTSLTLANTAGIERYQWLWLENVGQVWSTVDSVILGCLVQVREVTDATHVALMTPVPYQFSGYGAGTFVYRVHMRQNITLDRVHLFGNPTSAEDVNLLSFNRCENPQVIGCRIHDVNYMGMRFFRSAGGTVDRSYLYGFRNNGNGYGVGVHGGCIATRVVNSWGYNLRHFVTVGDDKGVSIDTSAINNHIFGARDSAIESHAAGDGLTANGNWIETQIDTIADTTDGITCAGPVLNAKSNTIIGVRGDGIRHAVQPGHARRYVSKIEHNDIRIAAGNGSRIGVLVVNSALPATLTGKLTVDVTANTIAGFPRIAVEVWAKERDVKSVVVSDNNVPHPTSEQGIWLPADSGRKIESATLDGNNLQVLEDGNTRSCVELGSGGGGIVQHVSLTGNTFVGGDRALRLFGTARNVVAGINACSGQTSADPIFAASGATLRTRGALWRDFVQLAGTAGAIGIGTTAAHLETTGTFTLILPDPRIWRDGEIVLSRRGGHDVNAASANIIPLGSNSAGSAIITSGNWVHLKSMGADNAWKIHAQG